MNFLSRILTRTPSLRARVAVATAIGTAIVVVIAGAVVWFGITNAWKERLDRRLDEAAGFAIPFLPRGLGDIPRTPNDQDTVITVRREGQVKSNSDITLPPLDAGLCRHLHQRGALSGANPGDPARRSRRPWRWVRPTTTRSPRPTTCIAGSS